jgi:hypothetical protein
MKKIWIFIDRIQWTQLTMVPKVIPKELLRLFTKNFFSPKINQNRVAYNDFHLPNNFHKDRLSFPVYGEKIKLGHFRPFLRLAVLKAQNFRQN